MNISRTGVLLETTTRLEPGRHTSVVIVGDLDEEERAEAKVLRTELVSITPKGELVYRTAMVFSGELDLRLSNGGSSAIDTQELATAAVSVLPAPPEGERTGGLQLEGPLPGFWSAENGSHRVIISQLSQTGCVVQGVEGATINLRGSVTVVFSAVKALTLTGCVAGVEPRGLIFQFLMLPGEVCRLLLAEIGGAVTSPARAGSRL